MCSHSYTCEACHTTVTRMFANGREKKQWVKCEQCGKRAYWSPRPPQTHPDWGTLRLSTLKPLHYTHHDRGKVDVVEGRYQFNEHIKRYNEKYGTNLVIPK